MGLLLFCLFIYRQILEDMMATVTNRLEQETGDCCSKTSLLGAVDEIKVEVVLFADDKMTEA